MASKIPANEIKAGDIVLSVTGFDYTVTKAEHGVTGITDATTTHTRCYVREMTHTNLLFPSETIIDVVRPSTIPVLTMGQIVELWNNLEFVQGDGWIAKNGAPRWVTEYAWDLEESLIYQMAIVTAEEEFDRLTDAYWDANHSLGDLRCLYCTTPYSEKSEHSCTMPGAPHSFDADDLARAEANVEKHRPGYELAKSTIRKRQTKYTPESCASTHEWKHADYGDGVIGHVCANCPAVRGPFKLDLETKV